MANLSYSGWRQSLKELKEMNEEYSKYYPTYTEAEKMKYRKSFNSKRDFSRNAISDGITKELFDSIEKVNKQRELLALYKKSELKSWDSAKLQAEYGVTSVILDMATVGTNPMTGDITSARVEKLWKEARDSGDKYKIRALADLLNGVLVKVEDEEERLRINGIKLEASETLKKIRETPDIERTKQEVKTSFDEFSLKLREYERIGELIDMSGELEWRIRNMRFGEDEEHIPYIEMLENESKK